MLAKTLTRSLRALFKQARPLTGLSVNFFATSLEKIEKCKCLPPYSFPPISLPPPFFSLSPPFIPHFLSPSLSLPTFLPSSLPQFLPLLLCYPFLPSASLLTNLPPSLPPLFTSILPPSLPNSLLSPSIPLNFIFSS